MGVLGEIPSEVLLYEKDGVPAALGGVQRAVGSPTPGELLRELPQAMLREGDERSDEGRRRGMLAVAEAIGKAIKQMEEGGVQGRREMLPEDPERRMSIAGYQR